MFLGVIVPQPKRLSHQAAGNCSRSNVDGSEGIVAELGPERHSFAELSEIQPQQPSNRPSHGQSQFQSATQNCSDSNYVCLLETSARAGLSVAEPPQPAFNLRHQMETV